MDRSGPEEKAGDGKDREPHKTTEDEKNGESYLQAWGVVQNLSGEDWTNVRLSLVAGAPLAFEAQLGEAIIPERPVVTDRVRLN